MSIGEEWTTEESKNIPDAENEVRWFRDLPAAVKPL